MTYILLLLMTILNPDGKVIQVSSPAFEKNGKIPSKYTCDGENINPPLIISGYPKDTKSIALIMEDPDATNGTFYHWVMWNIQPGDSIMENSALGIQGKNSSNDVGYTGPCPPDGEHRYIFRVYALKEEIGLSEGATRDELMEAIKCKSLSSGQLTGTYKK